MQDSMCVWILQLSMCKAQTLESWCFQKWVNKLAWMKYKLKIGWHHQGVVFCCVFQYELPYIETHIIDLYTKLFLLTLKNEKWKLVTKHSSRTNHCVKLVSTILHAQGMNNSHYTLHIESCLMCTMDDAHNGWIVITNFDSQLMRTIWVSVDVHAQKMDMA